MKISSNDFDYHYKVYLDKVIGLAATLVIKSSREAEDMNFALSAKLRNPNIVNLSDKRTWPYYLNLSGEYHPTDRTIEVISMDTTEKILFNKENLRIHRNTKKEYSYGTHNYEALIERYPDKELFVKGVLNPVDINKAINAPDGTILSYDTSFVEENEYTLIEELQKWIYAYFKRWYQPQYNIDNAYYNTTFMGVLYTKLVEVIISIRLDKCLTNEAHSYHYRRFLASHGFLDYYLDHLSLKQVLIFYKNIRWVEKYVGQRHTQKWLIEKIMTMRNLPVAEYNMVQYYGDLVDRDDGSGSGNIIKGNVVAKPTFEKVSLNGLENVLKEKDTLNLKQLMDKEDNLAFYNPKEREFEEKEARESLSGSLSAFLKTKVLQSKATDYSGSEKFTFENVLLDQWIDSVFLDKYKAYITIIHPITGESIPLSSRSALLLFTLATFKVNKINDDCIPDYTVGLTPRKNRPTKEDLRNVIPDNSLVSDWWIDYIHTSYVPLPTILTTLDFYDQALMQFNLINHLIDHANQEEHLDARSYKEMTVYQLYATKVISLRKANEMTFSEFLKNITLDVSRFKREDWKILADTIWSKITGLDNVNVKSLYNIHKSMLSLLTKLSSYSVHFIKEINESNIQSTNMLSLRLDNGNKVGKQDAPFGTHLAIEVLDTDNKGLMEFDTTNDNSSAIRVFDTQSARVINEFDIDVSVKDLKLGLGNRPVIHFNNRMGTVVFSPEEDLTGVDNPLNLPAIPGMRSWLLLPNEIKRRMIDQFGTDLDWQANGKNTSEPKESIDWNITHTEIDGLTYSENPNP